MANNKYFGFSLFVRQILLRKKCILDRLDTYKIIACTYHRIAVAMVAELTSISALLSNLAEGISSECAQISTSI